MEAAAGISPDTLVSLLSGGELGSTLVLDCRPFMAFNRGHVVGALNVHCPPILKRRSGGFVALDNLVPDPGERERLQSGGYRSVVVYDEATQLLHAADSQSDLLSVLKSLVQQVTVHGVFYLTGGYEAFSQDCPMLCETQKFSPLTATRSELQAQPHDEEPVEILPHLLLGNVHHSSDRRLLQRLGVTALVNVSTSCQNLFPAAFTYLHIPVHDSASADLAACFPEANLFIDKVQCEGGRVLVHCHAGRSRSATICLAYLMKTLNLSLDDAFEHVRSRREVIDPNLNFMQQLQDYRRTLDNEQSTATGVTLSAPPFVSASTQSPPRTPRQAVAPLSLPSALESSLLPPANSETLIPPPSPAMATDVQCFFTFSSPQFPFPSGSLTRTPEIPLPS